MRVCSISSQAGRGKATPTGLPNAARTFRAGVKVAALDPFQGYKSAIDDNLEDAVAVLDAFHIVKLGTAAVDECRRRVQQETLSHRGRKGDPLYGIQNLLRAGAEKLTDKQWARFDKAIAANEESHLAVYISGRSRVSGVYVTNSFLQCFAGRISVLNGRRAWR